MLNDVFLIIAVAGALAGVCALAAAGFRNGDRAADAQVTALVGAAAEPDEEHPLIIATVRNAAGTPVIAALRALLPPASRPRAPSGWPAGRRAAGCGPGRSPSPPQDRKTR